MKYDMIWKTGTSSGHRVWTRWTTGFQKRLRKSWPPQWPPASQVWCCSMQ